MFKFIKKIKRKQLAQLYYERELRQVKRLFIFMNESEEMAAFLDSLTDPNHRKKRLKGKHYKAVIHELIKYFVNVRLEIVSGVIRCEESQKILEQQLEIIDTALLRWYMMAPPLDVLAASILRLNNCHLKKAERVLKNQGNHNKRTMLHHVEARKLLRKQTKREFNSKSYSTENLSLIFKFSDWILKKYPEEGLKIFTEDLPKVDNMTRAKILNFFLKRHDSLVIPYLNHAIQLYEEMGYSLNNIEKVMMRHGQLSELITLYNNRGHHIKSLQLLREQSKKSNSCLKGCHSTVTYLQDLGADNLDLIFKHSDWILKDHPEDGLRIFTEDNPKVETLPRAKVLDFLLKQHASLVIPYLEYVIHTWNDKDPTFHDALVTCYRQKITEKSFKLSNENLQHRRQKLSTFLRKPTSSTPDKMIVGFTFEDRALQDLRQKLLTFLEKSTSYTPDKLIIDFPIDSMFEERALILGKLGNHEHALAIYLQILGDVDGAMRYCEKVNQSPNDKSQYVYVILMRILMNPEQTVLTGPLASVPRHPKTSVPNLETALDIMAKYADIIPPMEALSLLPDSVPLIKLKSFYKICLPTRATLKGRTQLLKAMHFGESLKACYLKHFLESTSVVIDIDDQCAACKKHFGNQAVFLRYPDGDIVHYSCRSCM